MREKGVKQKNVAHHNNKLVANLLVNEPLSCIELSRKTKLTHVATGIIVDRLLNMNLIRLHTDPPKKRTQGRQHVRYEINPHRAYYICISFKPFKNSFTIYDLMGRVVYSEGLPDDKIDDIAIDRLEVKIRSALKWNDIDISEIAVASIAVPGRVDPNSGRVVVSSKIDQEFNVKEKFREVFPLAVIDVKNDIDYACLGSILSEEFDYAKGSHLYLCAEEGGTACCVVYNKEIVCGANGFGGEIGMARLDRNEDRLYDIIPIGTMTARCRRILGDDHIDIDAAIALSQENPAIREEFVKTARTLGTLLSNFVAVLGCSHIVFAGSIAKYPEFFFDEFKLGLFDPNYSDRINYQIDVSMADATGVGQSLLSRLRSLDWVMEQY